MNDLELIAAKFVDQEVPKGKEYLMLYFDQPMQRTFISYYFCFPAFALQSTAFFHRMLSEHTGMYCSLRIVQTWLKRVRDMETVVKRATASCDLSLLHRIKSGHMPWTKIRKIINA